MPEKALEQSVQTMVESHGHKLTLERLLELASDLSQHLTEEEIIELDEHHKNDTTSGSYWSDKIKSQEISKTRPFP